MSAFWRVSSAPGAHYPTDNAPPGLPATPCDWRNTLVGLNSLGPLILEMTKTVSWKAGSKAGQGHWTRAGLVEIGRSTY